ncbi:disintegrin and metalloproteinase domain-containing protein 28 [Cimex lectularius]|uniref:Mind-meld n=1 Tax=Cimex lectularius TaxID=79782 RepID=A0A8I6S6J7_CIMLE|nr:disintegrin and metalloproteinase domain-containing protein 28 [Cimex lectularius]
MTNLVNFVLCAVLISLNIGYIQGVVESFSPSHVHPSPQFSKHSVVRPKVFHGRDKRPLTTTKAHKEKLEHVHDLTMSVLLDGQEQILDLQLNRNLIPKDHFISTQKNGSKIVHRPLPHEVELCHYHGKVRGMPSSWAAVSTCNGIRGMIHDGKNVRYIEKSPSNDGDIIGEHLIYDHADLTTNHTCGYEGTPYDILDFYERSHHANRAKRSLQSIRGPYNANKRSRYVELVLVVDNKLYEAMNKNLDTVHAHTKDLGNIINSLYMPLNIFIALVGVVVWTELDEIELSTKGDTTLTNFLHYRRGRLVKDHPNDNAQLLTRVQFEGGVVGKALKGPMCTFEFSGGVSMDHSPVVGLVATTVAHEMGHNFGMEHDTKACDCPDDRCIMAASSSTECPTHWSSCSLRYLAEAFEHGMDYCLRNRPESLFDSPVCGNGFVEPGEQCDCGLKDRCTNPCCNASTCMLHSNASCATGECCDLSTCHPKTAGHMCRSADHECDLPEYCTGESEYCPNDVYKMDGESCSRREAFCYKGECRSHNDQCKLLWGPSGKSSNFSCYQFNTKGSRHGNCGYNRLNQSYIKCYDEHIFCGMLHCMHLNERLEFGMESVSILSHSFINAGKNVIPCRTAIVDLGINEVDPGLAPDGAKCAEGKMCVGQKCLAVESLTAGTACKNNCNGNGVCNSLGHCHCNPGYAPPFCQDPGTGGSEDSGPATQPNARREVINAFYIIFLGIVPGIALASLFIYYIKRSKVFGKRPRQTIFEKKHNHLGNAGGRHQPMEISGPMNVDHSRATLLPKQDSSEIRNELLGQFKGFSITPIQAKPVPIRPAPSAPIVQTNDERPIISRPVLEGTTSYTAQELMDKRPRMASPIRPAPKVPMQQHRVEEKKKDHPTLTRIASFMRGQKLDKNQRPRLDKETLRNLEISDPIPQTEIEVPKGTVSVEISRAQSMREQPIKRPQLPTFGSMRVQNKRPNSIPTALRPKSPPPMPPNSTKNVQTSYDDCLNVNVKGAPLAKIEDDSPKENIYAVIEESPVEQRANPKPLEPADELLNEIVSEIEARNTESIYSASTLKKKKKSTDEESSDYMNTSWSDISPNQQKSSSSASSSSSNSGYMSPISTQSKPIETEVKPIRVPDTSAPYKPYNSALHRGPLANAYRAQEKPPLKRTKTPPSLEVHKKPLSIAQSKDKKQPTKLVKPDIVSSCEGLKSPDVISSKEDKEEPKKVLNGRLPQGNRPAVVPKPKAVPIMRTNSKVASLQKKFENQANR